MWRLISHCLWSWWVAQPSGGWSTPENEPVECLPGYNGDEECSGTKDWNCWEAPWGTCQVEKWDEAFRVEGIKGEGTAGWEGCERLSVAQGGRVVGAQTNLDWIAKALGCHPKGFSCFLKAVLVLLHIHLGYLHESKIILMKFKKWRGF